MESCDQVVGDPGESLFGLTLRKRGEMDLGLLSHLLAGLLSIGDGPDPLVEVADPLHLGWALGKSRFV